MISLEQVKLLETRVARAIEYVERVTGENNTLVQREAELQAKLDTYQKRIDELEVVVMRFKEDQSRIEDGIIAALDRLNQFEEAVEKSLTEKQTGGKPSARNATKPAKPADAKTPKEQPAAGLASAAAAIAAVQPASGEMFFEIPEAHPEKDIDPLNGEDEDSLSAEGELEIF